MTTATTDVPIPGKRLLLWLGVALGLIVLLARFVVPVVAPAAVFYGMLTSFPAAVLVLVWWVTASRARWQERVAAVALVALGFVATPPLLHASIRGGGMGN